ncbi:c-type cytochrome [Pigmentiphaga litoralis]|uniref:c-type cytochrome n=1 Tax=Pigmentiphaga litoralis TaxID=516702 RepID=UPI003B42DB53
MRNAPRLTDKAAWAPRLAQPPGTLTAHVIKGLGWMPPRGTCSACSDEEIQAAVDYMVSRLPK